MSVNYYLLLNYKLVYIIAETSYKRKDTDFKYNFNPYTEVKP